MEDGSFALIGKRMNSRRLWVEGRAFGSSRSVLAQHALHIQYVPVSVVEADV